MGGRAKALRSLIGRGIGGFLPDQQLESSRFRRQVLVVCHGNQCRSPFAAALLEQRLPADTWRVFSAGIGAIEGAPANTRTLRVAEEFGVDLSAHRSELLGPEHVRYSGLIFTMSRFQADTVSRVERGAATRIRMLGAFAPAPNLWQLAADPSHGAAEEEEIADPVNQSSDLYRQCFERIGAAVENVVAWLLGGALSPNAPPTADLWVARPIAPERRASR